MKSTHKFQILFVLLIFVSLPNSLKADSWHDPSWSEMLDSSDVIALITYRSSGEYKAKASIEKIYKGNLKEGDKILISGFSNRYGPHDQMFPGKKYLVFLVYNERRSTIKRKAYRVWSPTSGDLRVKGKEIQYDLMQTSFYEDQNYFSFSEFEAFLKNYFNKIKTEEFCKVLVSKLSNLKGKAEEAQYLFMLYFLGYNQFDKNFETYITSSDVSVRYALAKLMRNMNSASSRDILVKLLDDKHGLVQGEAVRGLSKQPADFIGPILVNHIASASPGYYGASNIMNPVRNTIDGGQTEIISTLATIKYKPAVPALLPLLKTTDEDLFGLVYWALIKLDSSKDVIPYIKEHLYNKEKHLIYLLSKIIVEDSLTECLPAYKDFISTHNRNLHPDFDYTLSTYVGIGHFKDSSTVNFILSDLEHFFTYKDTIDVQHQLEYFNEYIKTLGELKVERSKPLVYKIIYDWTGLNDDFGKYPELFKIKKSLEDSLKNVFTNKFKDRGYSMTNCAAFILNTDKVVSGQKPMVRFLAEIYNTSDENTQEQLNMLSNETGIKKEDIFLGGGNIYYTDYPYKLKNEFSSSPLNAFLEYTINLPTNNDLVFLKTLRGSGIINDDFDLKQLDKAINKLIESLH